MTDATDTLVPVSRGTESNSTDVDSLSPIAGYRREFESLREVNDTREPEWLQSRRTAAIGMFEASGFPTMKDEDWHFTNVAPIAAKTFRLAPVSRRVHPEAVARLTFGQVWHSFVFVNGRFTPQDGSRNLPDGISVQSLSSEIASGGLSEEHFGKAAPSGESAFTALNEAMTSDGALIRIEPNASIDTPIHLVFLSDASSDNGASHPRNIIVAGTNSRCTVIESYASAGGEAYFTNAVSEVFLAEGANLSHYKLQNESPSAYHVGTIAVRQERSSRYESFSFATGADLSRTNVYTTLAGDGAEVVMNGLYMVDGKQHVDHQTRIEHVAPNCPSHELYKGILDGRSHGVFNGKVYVHPEAQKTDGKQSNNNLLLSDAAKVDTKPQLEIFADDVKCTHGATVGRLDETALFYMRSRGVGVAQARRLLTYAFAADVLEKIELEPLRDALEAQVLARFTA
ncbi:MAG TPA: Fe-S cluster assembly protein SufD [Gemmatimonadaceae bacterium]|nr:Fe-S cluster assembly protein SufD [Gemmatimonadaceae bacterium]